MSFTCGGRGWSGGHSGWKMTTAWWISSSSTCFTLSGFARFPGDDVDQHHVGATALGAPLATKREKRSTKRPSALRSASYS
jgi:hypothetical protein